MYNVHCMYKQIVHSTLCSVHCMTYYIYGILKTSYFKILFSFRLKDETRDLRSELNVLNPQFVS